MRLGLNELSILGVVASRNGYASIGDVKYELSGFRTLSKSLPVSMLLSVSSVHCSLIHSVGSLESKGLIRVDRKGKRIVGVTLDYYSVVRELLYRCSASRRGLLG